MREYLRDEILNVSHLEFQGLVRSIWSDEAAAPSVLDHGQELCSICVLADRKARSDLPTQPVTPARLKGNTEAALSIHESRDVRGEVHFDNRQGRRFMKPLGLIQGSQP
jgi:hypothetical protein